MTLEIRVTGRVQGVFFRKYTQKKALDLGLTGFVSNRSDGTVYCVVTGCELPLKHFMEWLKVGSPLSKVDSVDGKEIEPLKFTNFEIR
jgi:acylphosphatase